MTHVDAKKMHKVFRGMYSDMHDAFAKCRDLTHHRSICIAGAVFIYELMIYAI